MVWPGDMGVSVQTAAVTTGDLISSQNSLNTLFKYQDPDGMLPYVGPPIAAEKKPGQEGNSDTYHLWALIGTYNVVSFSGNTDWLKQVWPQFKKGVAASTAKIDKTSNLMIVDRSADWVLNLKFHKHSF